MANVIYALVAVIITCYLLRWAFMYIIKRERPDMASERERIRQEAVRGFRINKRVAHWLWKMSWRSK
jgi:hypothetical protein